VFSGVQAYLIEKTVSEQHVDIYRRYVKQDESISRLRRNTWLAGNHVRDFFLSSDPDRSALLRSQFRDLDAQNREDLRELEQFKPSEAATQLLKINLQEYWTTLEPIPESMATVRPPVAYKFIQREVVPRRSAVYDSLQRITEADQALLQKNETQFVDKRQDAVRGLVFMLGLCVVLGILVACFSLRHARRLEREAVKQYDEVARAKRDMQQLSARLLDIEEDSRRRLSRGLHDEIGQTLALLQIELSHALSPDGQLRMRERLERARELAGRTVQTVRNISLLLRPALLDDLGLVPALQWLLEDFQRRSGVCCEFVDDGVKDLLPDSVKTCVYRVVQEALHNCEKYAGASQVRVAVRQSSNLLRAEIEDNGRGLELNTKGMPRRNAGLGILGMRERAARVGGTLALQSSPGLGTQVCLQIPLAELAGDSDRVMAVETGLNSNVYSNPVGG
jgi:signal transduction histidine kinase